MQHILFRSFQIVKWPVALISIIGFPGMASMTWKQLTSSFNQNELPFWIGLILILILWQWRLRNMRWTRFFTTMEHEALHAIIGFLSFVPIKQMQVREDGSGHVTFTPPANWLMLLAPYFIPLTLCIYAAIIFALNLDPVLQKGIMGMIFGLEWAGNIKEIHPKQTDFRQAGILFSILFLPSAILMSYGTALTIMLAGDVHAGWLFAQHNAMCMWNDTISAISTVIDMMM